MHYSHSPNQQSLFSFEGVGFRLKDHALTKLSEQIPWQELVDLIKTQYSDNGRNSKSIRMMIALELAKTMYQMSNEQVVARLKTDAALMKFCGFNSPMQVEAPDSSSLTNFRKKLTPEIAKKISDLSALRAIEKLPPRKRTQVSADTTCLPINLAYPTDTALLIKVASKLEGIACQAREQGQAIVLRGKKKVNETIKKFRMVRKKTKTQINTIREEVIEFVKRNTKKLEKIKNNLSHLSKKKLTTIKKIIAQQEQLLKDSKTKIKDRIISFHEPDIRAIYRGKGRHKQFEFGLKGSVISVGQEIVISGELNINNVPDSSLVKKDLERFEQVTGRKAKEYSGDRGYHSPKNHKLLEEEGIYDGIMYKGKIPKKAKLPPKNKLKRMYKQRAQIEARIGILKNCYGLDKINYKSKNAHVRFELAAAINNFKVSASYS